MLILSAFACGLIFGLGLILGGMTNPANVIGFLDLAGDWNPSLALVMGGAVMVATGAFFIARQRATSLMSPASSCGATAKSAFRAWYSKLMVGSQWLCARAGVAGRCRKRLKTSKASIPTSIAVTKVTACGMPAPSATMAGPGQKPPSPQPAPNSALPMIRRGSRSRLVGNCIGAPSSEVAR